MVVWIIGKSGSGKTFISKKIFNSLRQKNKILIDGDQIRTIFYKNKLGFNKNDRKKNAQFITRLCKFLEKNDLIVICAIQSIFPEMQKENRKQFKKYLQIYMKVNNDVLIKRNNKNIYKKKNVVGLDIKFPEPVKSDLVIHNNFKNDLLREKKIIIKMITKKIH